ncbi:enoyl-CoA hydratase/isomerase family protein [Halobacterium sp. KA-6]|uniref:enoyl-CoA hydratase/isomerase family protein n=1 Tax=Halobacterium sp. KA-6 TaxID=2896368 RepID=UPI001E3D2B47|nr:enoyl-CoA hydratase/isomerase family protein [Halobacterium sp. KA-6]MCD2203367.1 enoyl-CoA hydratase/isomerase family protein [Halobacterium sp. KA-6]
MPSESLATVEWDLDEDTGIATIMLNRPDVLNALSSQLREDVITAFKTLERLDDESDGVAVSVVVLEGAGEKAFCAGADITEFSEVQTGSFNMSPVTSIAEEFVAPVIAKIDGYCLGGGLEVALSCDFRFASEDALFGFSEVNLGLIPGGGGTQRLAELVGPSRAKRLSMTGEKIDGNKAAEDGIVNEAVPEEELDETVQEFAQELSGQPPLSIRSLKDVVNRSQEVSLAEGRRYERRVFDILQETEDADEGTTAFAEDREPEWQGK